MKAEHDVWYGVIDGNKLHGSIMECRTENPMKLESFIWKVFVVIAAQPLEE